MHLLSSQQFLRNPDRIAGITVVIAVNDFQVSPKNAACGIGFLYREFHPLFVRLKKRRKHLVAVQLSELDRSLRTRWRTCPGLECHGGLPCVAPAAHGCEDHEEHMKIHSRHSRETPSPSIAREAAHAQQTHAFWCDTNACVGDVAWYTQRAPKGP